MKKKSNFFSSKYFSLLIIIVALLIIFTIWSKGMMLKPLNIRNILNNVVLLSFIGIGACFLMLYGEMDISSGAIGSFSACMSAMFAMNYGIPDGIAIILALLIGCVIGFLNALMINKLKFPPFIATMSMSYVLQGLGYLLVTALGVSIKKLPTFNFLGDTKFFDNLVPMGVLISILFLVVYGLILAKTKFGRTIYLCGGNRLAAKLCGLNPTKLSYILYINSAFLASVSGIMYVARVKTALPTALTSYQFTGITAAVLGGVAFGGGSGNILGCALGMLVLAVFNNGVSTVGFNANYTTVFNGVLLIVGLALDAINARRSARKVVTSSLASLSKEKSENKA
ncbi:MAG: ABC transporter permease [Oscillospiraceae bacterium]|nr:ABC transporter permease [Oscillospiraceae bacterium]